MSHMDLLLAGAAVAGSQADRGGETMPIMQAQCSVLFLFLPSTATEEANPQATCRRSCSRRQATKAGLHRTPSTDGARKTCRHASAHRGPPWLGPIYHP